MTRTARSRKHKGFDLEKRLAAVEPAIERRPLLWRGCWRKWHATQPLSATALMRDATLGPYDPSAQRFESVKVDLGCGKGAFTVESARREPSTLFVGIDSEPVCSMHAAELALEQGVPNAVFTIDEDPHISKLFAPGEVAAVYLNFPAPCPKKKHAPRRLTYASRLLEYRAALAEGGELWLRTDSKPLLLFSLNQLELAGFEVLWQTDDCRAARPNDPVTLYEQKLSAQGAKVLALRAVPGKGAAPKAEDIVQTAPLSLYDYLPDNLDELDYIPHGMANGIENLRNHRSKLREKEDAESGC